MRCKRGQRREECGKHCSVVSDDDECDDDDDDENVDRAPTPSSIRENNDYADKSHDIKTRRNENASSKTKRLCTKKIIRSFCFSLSGEQSCAYSPPFCLLFCRIESDFGSGKSPLYPH